MTFRFMARDNQGNPHFGATQAHANAKAAAANRDYGNN